MSCDLHTGKINCTAEDDQWYQSALYFAGDRDGQGFYNSPTRAPYPIVHLTRGVTEIKKALAADAPYHSFIGMHVPRGVSLVGVPPAFGESIIRPSSKGIMNLEGRYLDATKEGERLSALVLVANTRVGNNYKEAATANTTVENLVLSGDLNFKSHSCEGDLEQALASRRAILVGKSEGGIHLRSLKINQVSANAIELGDYSPWHLEDPNCSSDFKCKGIVSKSSGFNPSDPNTIDSNVICQAGYGGITIIGDHVRIANNSISKITRTWVNNSKGVGSTMGISASFVGAEDVTIQKNIIQGADYGIGSDGSFPLGLSISLFKKHWSQIYNQLGADFQRRYSSGLPLKNNELDFQGLDYILSLQVLLDLASEEAVKRNDETGFGSDIQIIDNDITGSTVGISLFKMKNSNVYGNRIRSTEAFNKFGLLMDESYNVFAYSNTINWWEVGVMVRGLPGNLTKYGSSYNGVGTVPPTASVSTWSNPGNIFDGNLHSIIFSGAGYNNSARNNQIKGGSCDFSGGKNTNGGSWISGNSLASCNKNY